jgi:acetyl esterase/lipase
MKHVRKQVDRFSSGRATGYGAAYTVPVFAAVAAISLWLNATRLQWLGLAHVVVLAKLVLLLAVHELLRPFCLSFGDVCALTAQVNSAANAAVLDFVRRGLRPKFPEWTLWYEWFQAVALAAGRDHGGHILKTCNAAVFRRNFELVGRLLGFVACWRHGHQLRSFRFNGLEHLWLRPGGSAKTTESSTRRRVVVLYYHGGGYALFSPRFFVEFACRLLTQVRSQLRSACGRDPVDVQILLANYRKLPEVSFPTPLDDAMAMFDYLVQHEQVSPRNIILAGDSAGGGLVLATLLRLRRAGRAMPLAALCSCPYADLSADVAVSEHCFISKSMLDAIRDLCVQEPARSWQEGAMLNTDLRGLPPLFVQAAEFDILHRQSLQLVQNARSKGVRVEMDLHAHMPHVFTLFPHFVMPQSSVGIERFAAFITRQLAVRRIPVQLPRAAPAF